MRNEIEKVIADMRDPRMQREHVACWVIADRLQSILDNDPVSKLEAMGATFIVQTPTGELDDEGSEIVTVEVGFWNKERSLAPSEPLGKGNLSEAYRDAATRLLARIEKEGE